MVQKSVTTDEIRSQIKGRKSDERCLEKANILTKIGYCTIDAAETFIMEADSQLKHLGCAIRQDDKFQVRQAKNYAVMLRRQLQKVARVIYEIEDCELALEDSDYLADLIWLIIDRCGKDPQVAIDIRKMILEKFPSNLGMYDNVTDK